MKKRKKKEKEKSKAKKSSWRATTMGWGGGGGMYWTSESKIYLTLKQTIDYHSLIISLRPMRCLFSEGLQNKNSITTQQANMETGVHHGKMKCQVVETAEPQLYCANPA